MKRKIIALIIAAVVLLCGCILTTIGIIRENQPHAPAPVIDPFSITEDSAGQRVRGPLTEEMLQITETEAGVLYLSTIYTDESYEDFVLLPILVPHNSTVTFERIVQSGQFSDEDFYGTFRLCDADMVASIKTGILEYCHMIYEIMNMEVSDAEIEKNYALVTPCYVEMEGIQSGTLFIVIGAALIAAAVIAALIILFGKKSLLILAGLLLLMIALFFVLFWGKFRTMASIKEVTSGLYTMHCRYDYDCDDFLAADISNIEELIRWIEKRHLFGVSIPIDPDNFGCCGFAAETPEGKHLFGRNFDYDETDALLVYTDPKDGYAALSMVDLRFFDIGTEAGMEGDSLAAKAIMLAAPYIAMDGVNEAGVGVGILQLSIDELHQDNGKPDLLVYAAIRGILDKCATVEEAKVFLEGYDIHSALGDSYHLFITDKTGASIVVEWTNEQMYIVEDAGCTNDVLSQNEFYDPEWSCRRYDAIHARLEESEGILTPEEAMALTEEVSLTKKNRSTQWSCIYHQDDFAVDICLDRHYGEAKHFDATDFGYKPAE
ncbi:MAG: linear amide C-N hydrolase [Oscillospiraceae bacterium]|nr:linear amide C-N hydrolase [Oscillospiraceae bacterium]